MKKADKSWIKKKADKNRGNYTSFEFSAEEGEEPVKGLIKPATANVCHDWAKIKMKPENKDKDLDVMAMILMCLTPDKERMFCESDYEDLKDFDPREIIRIGNQCLFKVGDLGNGFPLQSGLGN